jgi:hypothetical protein
MGTDGDTLRSLLEQLRIEPPIDFDLMGWIPISLERGDQGAHGADFICVHPGYEFNTK